VLVADFGIAKALSSDTNRQTLLSTGMALGTPAYMSPSADPNVDHRADIYAFGALGYELLTGEAPFVRRSAQQTIAAHMTEAAPRVTTRRPATPPALGAPIARCLEKQPSDRRQAADEIVAERFHSTSARRQISRISARAWSICSSRTSRARAVRARCRRRRRSPSGAARAAIREHSRTTKGAQSRAEWAPVRLGNLRECVANRRRFGSA
jgi:serine/threonine protein kinase